SKYSQHSPSSLLQPKKRENAHNPLRPPTEISKTRIRQTPISFYSPNHGRVCPRNSFPGPKSHRRPQVDRSIPTWSELPEPVLESRRAEVVARLNSAYPASSN